MSIIVVVPPTNIKYELCLDSERPAQQSLLLGILSSRPSSSLKRQPIPATQPNHQYDLELDHQHDLINDHQELDHLNTEAPLSLISSPAMAFGKTVDSFTFLIVVTSPSTPP